MKIQMDDQTGAYYLDYENFINKPSLVSYFVNDSGYATEKEYITIQLWRQYTSK